MMTYEQFKEECLRLVSDIHGFPVSALEGDEEQLREFYEDGESPISVALACKPEIEAE